MSLLDAELFANVCAAFSLSVFSIILWMSDQ